LDIVNFCLKKHGKTKKDENTKTHKKKKWTRVKETQEDYKTPHTLILRWQKY